MNLSLVVSVYLVYVVAFCLSAVIARYRPEYLPDFVPEAVIFLAQGWIFLKLVPPDIHDLQASLLLPVLALGAFLFIHLGQKVGRHADALEEAAGRTSEALRGRAK